MKVKPPLKCAALRPNYDSVGKNGGVNGGRQEQVLTRQVTKSGTRRHDWTRTITCGDKSIFIYIIQRDVSDFSKLSTAWVFIDGGGGSYVGFSSTLK